MSKANQRLRDMNPRLILREHYLIRLSPRSPWQPPVSLGAERCFSNSENDYVQAKTSH